MLNINGIKKVEDVCECGGCYNYFTDKSMEQNVFITEESEIIELDEEESIVFTTISVIHYDENNAKTLIFFRDNSTDAFENYMVIKNVFDIYNNHSLEDFLNIMIELSFGICDTAELTNEKHKEEVYTLIAARIDEIKDYIYEEQS